MVLKLLPLQGDRLAGIKNPGRCPGLGASALSGRVGGLLAKLELSINNLFHNRLILTGH